MRRSCQAQVTLYNNTHAPQQVHNEFPNDTLAPQHCLGTKLSVAMPWNAKMASLKSRGSEAFEFSTWKLVTEI